jgi:hypothetical protein
VKAGQDTEATTAGVDRGGVGLTLRDMEVEVATRAGGPSSIASLRYTLPSVRVEACLASSWAAGCRLGGHRDEHHQAVWMCRRWSSRDGFPVRSSTQLGDPVRGRGRPAALVAAPRHAGRGERDGPLGVGLHDGKSTTRIVARRTSDVRITPDGEVTLGSVAGRSRSPNRSPRSPGRCATNRLARTGSDGWLIPGRHAGQHITADRLQQRLKRHGIGIHVSRAAAWARMAGSTYADYVAVRLDK